MLSDAQWLIIRCVILGACGVLVVTLAGDLGRLRARGQRIASIARSAAETALARVDQRASLDSQRRSVEQTARAVLAANGEDPANWRIAVMVSGTSVPPLLAAIVETSQPVETDLIGAISGKAARVEASATIKSVLEPRVIARLPDPDSAGI